MIRLAMFAFLAVFFVTMLSVGVGLAWYESQRRKLFSQMLRTVEAGTRVPERELLRPAFSESIVRAWLQKLPARAGLNRSLRQSGLDWTAEKLLGMCAAGAILGGVIGFKVHLLSMGFASAAVFCVAGALAP